MRVLVSRLVPVVEMSRGARTAGLGVLAGLVVALAAIVSLDGPSSSDPQSASEPNTASRAEADPGGETVVAKIARAVAKPMTRPVPSRKPAVTAALAPPIAPPRDEEPNLAGLGEIPRDLLWNRPADSGDKPEPKAFAVFSKGGGPELPWDAVEPVPFTPPAPAAGTAHPTEEASAGDAPSAATLSLPDGGDVGAWIKSKVTEVQGTDRRRPLYHFELWLEPPAALKRRLVGVAYNFNSPAVMPQQQASSDQASGFRISAGGLACADKITVTLRFDDGRSQTVALDGCKLLG
ncbi:hypothetical protein [Methyloceanibacter sp.]|uniref:hypothetical protein n=1 Tax=Methyloceanibacter sp. TaxID=1965321 RepID=UPI003D6C9664